MGDGHFVFEGGAPLLAALLDVLKEAVNDQYDYISWWLFTMPPRTMKSGPMMKKTKWCLKEPEAHTAQLHHQNGIGPDPS